jgi:MoaA/NifB/PqqE/SkfB family radical SAM enzyme
MVITKYNFDDIQNMVRLAVQRRVSAVNVRLVIEPAGKGRPGHLCLPSQKYDELVRELRRAEKLAQTHGIIFRKDFSEEDLRAYLNLRLANDVKSLHIERELDERLLLQALNGDVAQIIGRFAACTFPFYELHINANGYAACCGTFASGGDVNLDIVDSVLEKNLSQIWYGKKLNHLRVLTLLHLFPPRCADCNLNLVTMSRRFRSCERVE